MFILFCLIVFIDFLLILEHILAMYDECRYETAWYSGMKSVWCTPFGVKDFEVTILPATCWYYLICLKFYIQYGNYFFLR